MQTCKHVLKQVESNLANVRSRSRTINVLEINCMRSDHIAGCCGMPSLSSAACREGVLEILASCTRERIELISFNYVENGSVMKHDIIETAAVELQNLSSYRKNAINVINRALEMSLNSNHTEKDASSVHLCELCGSMQKRELESLANAIKRNPLEARESIIRNKGFMSMFQRINKTAKNNGCGACSAKFTAAYLSPLKGFPMNPFYKDYAYASENDYGSLFAGTNTKIGEKPIYADTRNRFKTVLLGPYDVKGYQICIRKNQKTVSGHDIDSSDFNLYQYSVSLSARNILFLKSLSEDVKNEILTKSRSTHTKSPEDLRAELSGISLQLLDRAIRKPEWDDLADMSPEEKNAIAWMAVDNIVGYGGGGFGIYTPLIYDTNVTDFELKEVADDVYKLTCRHLYSRPKKMCVVDAEINKTEVENLVKNIVPRIAGSAGDTALFKNNTLETAGEIKGVGKIRCTINRPPITKGYHVEIRKHSRRLSIPELMALGEASAETFSLLWIFSLLSRMSVMFVGPVGSGKTTLMLASQAGAPQSLVWGVIGDIDELQDISGDSVLFKTEAGDSKSRDGVRNKLLRKRKDKVIVQEIRNKTDAEDYIKQRLQGEAILSTTHARSISELVDRFKFDFQIAEETVYKNVDAVVVMNERDRQVIDNIGIMQYSDVENYSNAQNQSRNGHKNNRPVSTGKDGEDKKEDAGDAYKIYNLLEYDYERNTWRWKNKKGETVDFFSALADLSTVTCIHNALRMQEIPLSRQNFIDLASIGTVAINALLMKCFKKQPQGIYVPMMSDKGIFQLTRECLQTAYDLYIHGGLDRTLAIERLVTWLKEN